MDMNPLPPSHSAIGRWRSSRDFLQLAAFIAVVAGICLVALAGGIGIGRQLVRTQAAPAFRTTSPVSTARHPATGTSGQQLTSPRLATVAARAQASVVDVNTVVGSGSAAGTGIILTSSGEVLTNNHVVEGSTSIAVTIGGESASHPAHVVGVDPKLDVAVIQIEGVSGLKPMTLADSSKLRVGDPVVALGNAFGRGGAATITEGSIVALDQTLTARDRAGAQELTGMIQIDATIAPGDSGGPVVNGSGQVVGMITAGQSAGRVSTATNIGFAVPANTAVAVVNQVRAGRASADVILGQVGYLGVQVTDLTSRVAAQMGATATAGVLVTDALPGSPAASIGLGPNSIILSVNGAPVDSTTSLGAALHSHSPGELVDVGWTDGTGISHSASVTLTTGPAI